MIDLKKSVSDISWKEATMNPLKPSEIVVGESYLLYIMRRDSLLNILDAICVKQDKYLDMFTFDIDPTQSTDSTFRDLKLNFMEIGKGLIENKKVLVIPKR